ncbi:hypothetical protein MJO47_03940 [Desulfuromonas sp. KJ2020]|uniref:hypothetical protein n=1 Tax=Desulfuromonas sp. KJ2020 TaxID=2919173 RepID=UPI0003208B02|nr:hypothetical protein [Desulfuromonas sp. KJ2020]MCP3176246.1 hypothetical protein [Desulfuromonas sp. KJ2020]
MKADQKAKKEFDWFDHPQNIRKLRIGFYAVLVLLVVPDLFLHKHTLFSSVEAWPGFYALFGFIACVAIILISKVLGFVLKRPEDYYDR